MQRFAANKAKARQATSRQKLIAKIRSEAVEVKPSSRQNPYIRFEQTRALHRQAVEVEGLEYRYEGAQRPVFSGFSTIVEAGDRVAIVGANGAGKTTLLRCLAGAALGGLAPTRGTVKWSENADIGYMAQDVHPDFDSDVTVTDWIGRYEGGRRRPDGAQRARAAAVPARRAQAGTGARAARSTGGFAG